MVHTARRQTSPSTARSPAGIPGVFAPLSEPAPPRRLPSLLSYLQQVPDPRDPRGRRHPLAALLGLLCLAWLSGLHGYRSAHDWAAGLPPETRFALGFTRPQPPAASTLFEVLRALDWEALETQLRCWVAAVQDALRDPPPAPAAALPADRSRSARRKRRPAVDPRGVALDGKALRGSAKRAAELAGLLALVSHQFALTLAQTPLSRKEGELTAARPLLQELVLTGLVVTVDAQFTQSDLAALICDRGGEYVMRVKANQPSLLAELQGILSVAGRDATRRSVRTHETGHGRIETRQLIVQELTPEQQAALAWPGAAQVFVVVSQRVRKGKPVGKAGKARKARLIYGITSLTAAEAGPERLLRLYRGHWTVENRAFWERDVALGEDRSPATAKNLVAVLACLRGAVLTLLQAVSDGSGVTRMQRRFNADRAAALQALGCP